MGDGTVEYDINFLEFISLDQHTIGLDNVLVWTHIASHYQLQCDWLAATTKLK